MLCILKEKQSDKEKNGKNRLQTNTKTIIISYLNSLLFVSY